MPLGGSANTSWYRESSWIPGQLGLVWCNSITVSCQLHHKIVMQMWINCISFKRLVAFFH